MRVSRIHTHPREGPEALFKVLRGKKGEDNEGGKGSYGVPCIHTYLLLVEREGRGIVSVLRIFLRESSPGTIFSSNLCFTHVHMYLCHMYTESHSPRCVHVCEAHVSPQGLNCLVHITLSKDTPVLVRKSQTYSGGPIRSHLLWRAHSSPCWWA